MIYLQLLNELISLHDWPWISPWMKSISNELDITIHVLVSQLSGHSNVISNRWWRHQQNVNRASVRYKIMYALSWRTVYVLTRVWFWCLFFSRCCPTREINAKLPLLLTYKQSATRVHTLFYISATQNILNSMKLGGKGQNGYHNVYYKL